MFKILRYFGTLLLLSPIFSIIFNITASFFLIDGSGDARAEAIAKGLVLSAYASGIGLLAFAVGVLLQWWIACKTGEYLRSIWVLMCCMTILLGMFFFPAGLIPACLLLVLFFKLETFKRMRKGQTMLQNEVPNVAHSEE